MKNLVMITFLSLAYAPFAKADLVSAALSDQGDTVHLEISGLQTWDYDLRRVEKEGKYQYQLTVDRFDEPSLRKLEKFKSDMVRQVSVDKNGPDGKYVITFKASGDEVESFDYLTDQPSRLIVDFFSNSHKTKSELKAKADSPKPTKSAENKKTDPVENKVSSAKPQKKANGNRRPATTDILVVKNDEGPVAASSEARSGLFDGGDPNFERFTIKDYELSEEQVIRSKERYYIPYPMIQTENHYWEKMKIAAPIYEVVPKDTDENKQARLLLTLFEKKRYAVYLKTEEWFHKKYPDSQYNEVVDFMTADVFNKLWTEKEDPKYFEIAQTKYKQALQKFPQSPLVERTSLMLGYAALEKGDALNAIRSFNEHIEKNYAGSPGAISNDLARLGIGASLAKLNRYQEAAETYGGLQKSSPHKQIQSEAAFRAGDIYVASKNYAKAIESYRDAIKKYPEYQNEFPNAYYNQAEALFGLGDYGKSLDVYLEFIKKFPSHEHAAFAMTRLGELLEILGADKAKVVGAYLEAYFRYGENDNAIVARLRLINARMKSMKTKEVDTSVKEMLTLIKRLNIPNIEQFGTVLISEGYSARGEHEKSRDLLAKYYQQNPTTVDRDLFVKRIVGTIVAEIQKQVEQGEYIKALRTHKKFQQSWLKNNERMDTKFLIAKAFENAGVQTEAEKQYREVLNQIYSIKGTAKEKVLTVNNQKPNEDEVNLRLAATAFQQKKFSQSYDYLKNIKSPELLSENQQIERVRIAVDLLERRGDLDSAVRYLTELLRAWRGQGQLVAEPYLRLAQLELKQGKTDQAIESLKKVDTLMQDSKVVAPSVHAQSLETLGRLYTEKQDSASAISAYSRLLETYEDKRPLASIRYKLGQIYFGKGDIQKAAEIWGLLNTKKNEFWYNLAQEQLKNSDWHGDYKKYIQRIPAMSKQQ